MGNDAPDPALVAFLEDVVDRYRREADPRTYRRRRLMAEVLLATPGVATAADLEDPALVGRFLDAGGWTNEATLRSFEGALRTLVKQAHARGLIRSDPHARRTRLYPDRRTRRPRRRPDADGGRGPAAGGRGPAAGVLLRGDGYPPIVLGVKKPALSPADYQIVDRLLKAGAPGLTMKQLEAIHPDARKRMARLAASDPGGWGKVYRPAGRRGGRYRMGIYE